MSRESKNARFPVPGRWQLEQFASSQLRARSSSDAVGSSCARERGAAPTARPGAGDSMPRWLQVASWLSVRPVLG